MSALDLNCSNETKTSETNISDVKSKIMKPEASTDGIIQLDSRTIAECEIKEDNHTNQSRANIEKKEETDGTSTKDEAIDTSKVTTSTNEKSRVVTVEELMQDESITITPVGKAVRRSKVVLKDRMSKIPNKIPKAAKHRPWYMRKEKKNWREGNFNHYINFISVKQVS